MHTPQTPTHTQNTSNPEHSQHESKNTHLSQSTSPAPNNPIIPTQAKPPNTLQSTPPSTFRPAAAPVLVAAALPLPLPELAVAPPDPICASAGTAAVPVAAPIVDDAVLTEKDCVAFSTSGAMDSVCGDEAAE